MRMKVAVVSDTHGIDFKIPKCDLLVHCGDWSDLKIQRDEELMWCFLHRFLSKVENSSCGYFIFIAGNHDLITLTENFESRIKDLARKLCPHLQVYYLNNSSVIINDIKFWGSPVTQQINPKFKYWAHETNTPIYEIPDDTDVVITHQPPKYKGLGTTYWLDKSGLSNNYGSEELYSALLKTEAKYHFCGHIHTGQHRFTTYENEVGTKGINCSLLNEEYRMQYKPFTLTMNI